jgi:RimJ/RimL family protein N-acetyltransferase
LNLDLRTSRLLLRQWRPEDREPFAELNADPAVMEYFPALLSGAESDASADRAEAAFAQRGFGFWAVEIPGETQFAGFIGLSVPWFEAHFTPCVEIGWRLARRFWGRGYATEGARAALDFGFERLGLQEILSYAVAANTRSIRVMETIGMKFCEEFDHPALEEGHRLRRHVLYRLRK